ncbi:sugar porter family MFS transporter [Planctomyces sp. SH-PL62]|uniref:sugar porter family MFS transporter n=1 Tax=Planctomyces sp. SH-PL62 TaxID=1636152 RepID=UPI00078ED8A6|nr:sugar porter family MFS transporter [Planctomyces sp. SH-PL62]AMV38120.1 D-xylose-proton symporter [Planctomyces sp. SH-PL62]
MDVSFDRSSADDSAASGARSLSGPLIFATFVASLGGLLFGFDVAIMSGTTDALTRVFGLTGMTLGFTIASGPLGTVLGSLIAGKPADVWGRRPLLSVLAIAYLVSALGCALAWDWWSLLVFRILGGVAVGAASVIAPLYIAEIAPARYRGRLVATVQFNIVLGIQLAFLSNYVIAQLGLGEDDWRWMLGVQAIPSALFFVLALMIPESPRWLVGQGRVEEARRVLTSIGADEAVDAEIAEIEESLRGTGLADDDALFQRAYLKPILLAVAIAAFNQLSGINAVLFYAPTVFAMTGAGKDAALLQAVLVGGTNLIFTMLAMTVIDRFGRRVLMLVGSIGYILSLSATAWAFYTYGTEFTGFGGWVVLISLLVFIASHAFGQGAVIWVYISEVFPNRVRAKGQALGSVVHWIGALAITQTFPMIAERSGGHAFAFYAAMMVLQLVWVLTSMPETKGVPLERLQKELGLS